MNTIHRRLGSFDSMFIIPVLGESKTAEKQSDEELRFDVELIAIQQIAT